jgi:hypothetical protein
MCKGPAGLWKAEKTAVAEQDALFRRRWATLHPAYFRRIGFFWVGWGLLGLHGCAGQQK